SGLRVGEGGNDDELVGVGDDDPLDGVGVVGGAPQHGVALLDAHDPRQRVPPPGGVPDHADAVADDDRGAAELSGAHGGDDAFGGSGYERGPAAPVDGGDAADDRVLVLGSVLGAGP